MTKSVQTIAKMQPRFSAVIHSEGYQKLINSTIKDPVRASRFVASISSAVATNPQLQECDPSTILSGAMVGESLNLTPSPQLGLYYLVPFADNKNGRMVALFQLGYKGYIQLALRSGQYKRINCFEVKQGELVKWNPVTEELEINVIENDTEREQAETIGYVASIEYLNGFAKTIYWTRANMESHALRYSRGYSAKKGYTFWEKNFDAMALKTMLKQLISKWGVMSVDIQKAVIYDDSVVTKVDGDPCYIDNGQSLPQADKQAEADIQESAEDVAEEIFGAE